MNIKQNDLEKLEISIDNESEEEEKEENKDNFVKNNEQININKSSEKKIVPEKERLIKRDENEEEIKKIENERIVEEKAQRKTSNLSNRSEGDNNRGPSTQRKRESKSCRKEKDLLNQNINLKDESFIRRILMLIIEILVTFFLSLYPHWCDDFEHRNPLIDRKKIQETTKNEKAKTEEDNDIVIESMDAQPANQRGTMNSSLDFELKERNERTINKSNTDTRKVNNDDDQTKYHFVEEIENKTENEFVFSENVQIDNLSYFNEPVSEYKKKENENKVLNNK